MTAGHKQALPAILAELNLFCVIVVRLDKRIMVFDECVHLPSGERTEDELSGSSRSPRRARRV